MAQDTEHPDHSAIDGAMGRALAELDAMRLAASSADAQAHTDTDYTLHDVSEIGRYAVPSTAGWPALLALLQDPALRLAFAAEHFSLFDGIITGRLEQPPAPSLGDNLAAVRNFLLQSYYGDTPEGMTPEKARQALEEIASFVGDGLANHARGAAALHDPREPYLDAVAAAEAHGLGAQYLYLKILEWQRQSDWMRPFDAVMALFGGHLPSEWKLAADAPFLETPDFSPAELGPEAGIEEIEAAMAYIADMEARQRILTEEQQLTNAIDDFDMLGNRLVHTVEQLQDVSQMSEPVRRDAVEIAKDILRKLKVTIGEAMAKDGLDMHPAEAVATLGAVAGAAKIYERLLAWARGVDASILQHPSIIAATRAIGQLAVAAKMEAMRVAKQARDDSRAAQLARQIQMIPDAFHPGDATYGDMLERVERGIDTVLNRVQEISGPGAMVGHARGNDRGHYMSGTPIAGMALQASSEGVTNRDSTGKQQQMIQESIANANRAQLQRASQQLASQQARSSGQSSRMAGATAATTPARGNVAQQLNAMRQRLTQARQQVSTTLQGQQRMNAARNAMNAAHHHHEEELHHQDHLHQQQLQMQLLAKKLDLKGMRAATSTAGLTTAPVVTGRAAFEKMQKAATGGLGAPTKQGEKKDQLPPPPPPKKEPGRGF